MPELSKKTIWIVIFDLDGTIWRGSITGIPDKIAMFAGAEELESVLGVYPGTRETLERLSGRDDVVLAISSFNSEEIGLRILGALDYLKYFDPGNVIIAGPGKGEHVREIADNVLLSRGAASEAGLRVIFVDDRFYYHKNVSDFNHQLRVTHITSPGHHDFSDRHYREIFELIGDPPT
jgi:predicted phosphatase